MSTADTPMPTTSHLYEAALRSQRNRRLLWVALLLLLAGLAYGVYWFTKARHWIQTDNAYVTGNLVPVAAQASGIITQILAEETQFVHRGDVMVRLDEHDAYAALGRARGRLGETVRRINGLFFTQRQLEEKLSARRARLDVIRHDVERYRQASPSGAVSKQILQNAIDQLQGLEADVRETQAEYDALDAQIGGTTVMEHPAVDQAKHEFILRTWNMRGSRSVRRYPATWPNEKRKSGIASSRGPTS